MKKFIFIIISLFIFGCYESVEEELIDIDSEVFVDTAEDKIDSESEEIVEDSKSESEILKSCKYNGQIRKHNDSICQDNSVRLKCLNGQWTKFYCNNHPDYSKYYNKICINQEDNAFCQELQEPCIIGQIRCLDNKNWIMCKDTKWNFRGICTEDTICITGLSMQGGCARLN